MITSRILLIAFLLAALVGCKKVQHGYFSPYSSDLPVMAEVMAGEFNIGEGGNWHLANKPRPIQKVTIQYNYFISQAPISRTEWNQCVKEKYCKPLNKKNSNHNSAIVSWDETQTYLNWLNQSTGLKFRLPTEAEWEFAIKGKKPIPPTWYEPHNKESQQTTKTNYLNDLNIYTRLGQHGEWVQDCWNGSYVNLPLDGSPRLDGDCQKRTYRNRTMKADLMYMINGRHSFYKDMRGANTVFRVVYQK